MTISLFKAVVTCGAHLSGRTPKGEVNPWQQVGRAFYGQAPAHVKAIWLENELNGLRRLKERYKFVLDRTSKTLGYQDFKVGNLSAQEIPEPGTIESLVTQCLQEVEAANAVKAEVLAKQKRMTAIEGLALGPANGQSQKKNALLKWICP